LILGDAILDAAILGGTALQRCDTSRCSDKVFRFRNRRKHNRGRVALQRRVKAFNDIGL
jgi:hypothetical protein